MSHRFTAKAVHFENNTLVVRHTVEAQMCGICTNPMNAHPVTDDEGFTVCDRTEDDFGNYEFDYYLHPSREQGKHAITLVVDVEGMGTLDLTREDEWDSEHALGDFHADTDDNYTRSSAVANWRDQNPTEGTLTLQQAKHLDLFRSHLAANNSEARTAYVEGQDGYLSLQFVDEALTAKHHAYLLNVFRDKKTSDVRVGSVRIYMTVDGHYAAACVNRNCARGTDRPMILRNDEALDRDAMETFVAAVIRHGNNHAANWFADRPTFYKVHGNDCDLNCGDRTMPCNTNVKRPSPLTDDEVVAFLLEHNSHCKDANCKCSERLVELVPALR